MDVLWNDLLEQVVVFVHIDSKAVSRDNLDIVYQKIKCIYLAKKDKDKKQEVHEALYKADITGEISALLEKIALSWEHQDSKCRFRTLDTKALLYDILVSATTRCPSSFHLQVVENKVSYHIAKDLKAYKILHILYTKLDEEGIAGKICESITDSLLILDNLARTSQVRSKLEKHVLKEVCYYVDPDENLVSHTVLAISIIERLHPKNKIHKQLFKEEYLSQLLKIFVDPAFSTSMSMHFVKLSQQGPNIELDTFLLTLAVFARQDDYRCVFVSHISSHQSFLDKLLRVGTDLEIERLHKFLQLLMKHECNKCSCMFLMDLLLKHGVRIDTTSYPSLSPQSSLELSDGACQVFDTPKASGSGLSFKCEYMNQCHAFLQTLKVPDVYFDREHYRCFCEACFSAREDKNTYSRGEPPKTYALPKGWAKFSLKMSPRAAAMEIWDKWHMAFHGTSAKHVEGVLHVGDLLLPEDRAMDGRTATPQPGYSSEDSKCVFLSPSILYTGQDRYAPRTRFEYTSEKKLMYGRVAFQVRIKPESYKLTSLEEFKSKGNKAMLGSRIDPHFENSELEWSTDCRGVIMLVGILIRVDKENVQIFVNK